MKLKYDVIVIGGSMAGTSTALLLKRKNPKLSILVLEKNPKFGKRVGESTVEISSLFLTKTLGLEEHLSLSHLPKQGLRFWFTNEMGKKYTDCSEVGPKYNTRLSTFQVDRSILDEKMFELINKEGVEVLRPGLVTKVNKESVSVKVNNEESTISCRWIIDATGSRCMMAREKGWFHENKRHPISSYWARWKGVKVLDDLGKENPDFSKRCFTNRGLSTNHLMGKGWWAWMIPLQDGDTSVGIVYDRRLVEFGGKDQLEITKNLKDLLCTHPMGLKLMEDAEIVEGDLNFRKQIAYYCDKYAEPGLALVGDAAGMIDPFYSPGLDWLAHTVTATVDLIDKDFNNKLTKDCIDLHNLTFSRSSKRWFEALYQDKYYYMGDYTFMKFAYLMDTCLYYIGILSRPYKKCLSYLSHPPFGTNDAYLPYRGMKFYNNQLTKMAKIRLKRGTWGKSNIKQYKMIESYSFGIKLFVRFTLLTYNFLFIKFREKIRI